MEYILVYNYSQVVDELMNLTDTGFLRPLQIHKSKSVEGELQFFAMACIEFAHTKFTPDKNSSYIKTNTNVKIETMAGQLSMPRDKVMTAYRQRYDIYYPQIARCYGLEASSSGAPHVTLGMELFECMTSKASQSVINQLYEVSPSLLKVLAHVKGKVTSPPKSSLSNGGCAPVIVTGLIPAALTLMWQFI